METFRLMFDVIAMKLRGLFSDAYEDLSFRKSVMLSQRDGSMRSAMSDVDGNGGYDGMNQSYASSYGVQGPRHGNNALYQLVLILLMFLLIFVILFK